MTPADLLAAPGIENYPDLYPRLRPAHPRYAGDPARTPAGELAGLLAAAGRAGPLTAAAAAKAYREAGELDCLAGVAPDQVTAAAADWQRQAEEALARAEDRARLGDRERVLCPDGGTWVRRVSHLRHLLRTEAASAPGAVCALAADLQAELQTALAAEQGTLRDRLAGLRAKLDRVGPTLDRPAAEAAAELAARAGRNIDADDLFLAVQRLADLDRVLDAQPVAAGGASDRVSLPTRANPLGRAGFHFEAVVRAAGGGPAEVARAGLGRFLPDAEAAAWAANPKEFLALHARRKVPDRDEYEGLFAALGRWLGAGRGRRARLAMPNLEPKGKLDGRWAFFPAEPWQGAPFYDDPDGRPRLLAVVRLGVAEADRGNPRVVTRYAADTLRALLGADPVTADERRFRHEGLVVVLVPGELLSARPYAQFHKEVGLDRGARAGRVAYLDDLDLLRLLPAAPDARFRGLLELALPRFPDALSATYQNSDAVRPRMFYGRADELSKLENGTTVVFSGRRMGKSSLLRRLQSECGPDTDRRAVLVGCSTVGVGRSWQVLAGVERELAALVHREEGRDGRPPEVPDPAPTTDPAADLERSKGRFKGAVADALARLADRGVRRVYVLLDEADNFIRAELAENSGRADPRAAASWLLRDLQTITHPGRLRFIFAGYDQLGRLFRDPGLGSQSFGHWGDLQPLNLGPLDETAARALVVEPLSALGMPVPPDMADRILDYTAKHASLIQVFGRKLAEHVREREPDWPLNEVPVRFDHLARVAEDDRGAETFGRLLEQTLGLNLDIARAYPLRLVFLALVSPAGLGGGRILGAGPFSAAEAADQLRGAPGRGWPEVPDPLLADALDLLVQLGLLDQQTGPRGERAFRFRAWHYVTVLRTRNGFAADLRRAADDWAAGGRAAAEPRHVWTLPDDLLHALRRLPAGGPAAVVGLPRSGHGYVAGMLASPLADGSTPARFGPDPDDPADDPAADLGRWLADPAGRVAVVHDPDDRIPYPVFAGVARAAAAASRPLRWVGGPRLAWDLAGDVELAVELTLTAGLARLTAAEIEPWTARPLGDEAAGTAAFVHPTDADGVLAVTGGLLPVLESFRGWLRTAKGGVPDPLTRAAADEWLAELARPAAAERAAARLAEGVPPDLRAGLHHLFHGAEAFGLSAGSPADFLAASEELASRGQEVVTRVVDAGHWLGFVGPPDAAGRFAVDPASAVGLLVRHPRFAAP